MKDGEPIALGDPIADAAYLQNLYAQVLNRVRLDDPDACWPWPGNVNPQGYGLVCNKLVKGKKSLTHRVAYAAVYGQPTQCILHTCDNPPCCNPRHLQEGSRAQNAKQRDQQLRQTHGEGHYKALLTGAQVAEMRRRHAAGATAMGLSKQYKIKYRHAWKIVNNKIRKNG